jgi:hypothetical protein
MKDVKPGRDAFRLIKRRDGKVDRVCLMLDMHRQRRAARAVSNGSLRSS